MWGGRTGESQSLNLRESEEKASSLVKDMLELQVSFGAKKKEIWFDLPVLETRICDVRAANSVANLWCEKQTVIPHC